MFFVGGTQLKKRVHIGDKDVVVYCHDIGAASSMHDLELGREITIVPGIRFYKSFLYFKHEYDDVKIEQIDKNTIRFETNGEHGVVSII